MLEIIFVTLIVVLVLKFWLKNKVYFELSKILKHDLLSIPFLGIAYKTIGTNEDRMKQAIILGQEAFKHNGIYFAWFAYYPCIVVADPDLAEFISRSCLEKHDTMTTIFPEFFDNASIFAPVHIWRPRRKAASPIFSPKNLKQFVNIFAEQSRTLNMQLEKTVGKTISIYDYFTKYALASVCETTLGVNLNAQSSDEAHPFAESMNAAALEIFNRLAQPWLYNDFIYKLLPRYKRFLKHKKYIYDFVNELIKDKRKQMEKDFHKNNNESLRKSIMELLMESYNDDGKPSFSDVEVVEETLTLILAGTDTSATVAAFVALILARNPDIQEKIYSELKKEFPSDTQPVTGDNFQNLKYLEAVIKETLRFYPPVTGALRKTDKPITLPSGITLPKDLGIAIHIWAINRNPLFWGPDANEFKPERFLDGSTKHSSQFASFSLGPRNCIGFQYAMTSLKTALATFLHQYKVLPADPTKLKEPIRIEIGIMAKDVDNFMVKLELRKREIFQTRL